MCWNLEISLVACVYGFAACYYYYQRNFSTRDPWYAVFLGSFTLTQLLDAFFWSRADPLTGLVECDQVNLTFTQYFVTPVLFSQVLAITFFPASTANDWLKPIVRLGVCGVICLVGYIAQCTYALNTTGGWAPGPTLVYWGFIPPWWLFFMGVALWAIPALLFIYPTIYATNILLVGGLNLVLLQNIDGTIFLVSKLCFYCLQLSILWYFEPKWAPPGDDRWLVAVKEVPLSNATPPEEELKTVETA